mmetsp:Transcript_18555/g.44355  ORF Transcript_18555/g.44355 Transcript_18555/m.44355 type:complete len:157 (+) Transcript_18555:863-1333(+)
MERNCEDPYYVYESKCQPCFGTGSVRTPSGSHRRGHQFLMTCPHCLGLGVVRRTTTHFYPGDTEEALTIARGDEFRSQGAQGQSKASKKSSPASNPTLRRKPPSYYKPRKRPSQGTWDSGASNGASTAVGGNGAAPGANTNGASLSAAGRESAGKS